MFPHLPLSAHPAWIGAPYFSGVYQDPLPIRLSWGWFFTPRSSTPCFCPSVWVVWCCFCRPPPCPGVFLNLLNRIAATWYHTPTYACRLLPPFAHPPFLHLYAFSHVNLPPSLFYVSSDLDACRNLQVVPSVHVTLLLHLCRCFSSPFIHLRPSLCDPLSEYMSFHASEYFQPFPSVSFGAL